MSDKKEKFMLEAIQLSSDSIQNGGGPFGAVITKDNKIVAKAANSVTRDLDPTAHAEINAIRLAAKFLNSFDLSGCEIFSSCEPCPMCLSAIYWARIERIYFANTKDDAREIGFDDAFIYEEIKKPLESRTIEMKCLMRDSASVSFEKWKNFGEKIDY